MPITSDPMSVDGDEDGINDYVATYFPETGEEYDFTKDNAPLKKGIKFMENGEAIVGDMTIVACTNDFIGHSFLVYQSYIEDTLDFTGFTGGYKHSVEWHGEEKIPQLE